MKPTLTAFLLFSIFWLASCKKDEDLMKPAVVNMPFSLNIFRSSIDTGGVDINHQGTLILKEDYTWTLDFEGANSNGTYNWTSTTHRSAQIKFTITQWAPFSADIALSTKIKSVLETVDNCDYSISEPSFLNFFDQSYTVYLRTNKK